jgi:uncharacterized protein (DUF4415 family)
MPKLNPKITLEEALARPRPHQDASHRNFVATDDELTRAAEADPDNPPLTDAELDFIRTARRGGRPAMAPEDRKIQVTMRLSPDVVAYFRESGPGWSTRIDEELRRLMKRKGGLPYGRDR